MKRLFYLLLLLAIIVAIPAYLKRGDIARRVTERGILSAMLANPLVELGDGLHVTLCGAGGPLPDRKRSGPCVAVAADKRIFIFDAGSGGARTLGLLRYPLGSIEAVFLTHFHSDHLDGLGELATLRWVQGNHTSPLAVHGPDGVSDVVTGFNQVYAMDGVYRNLHHGKEVAPLSGHGMVAQPFAAPPVGEALRIYDREGVVIDTFSVDHSPVKPAVGYRIRYRGRSVLISGDTVKSQTVENLAAKVDLLVHEALSPELVNMINGAAVKTHNRTMERITRDILEYHASPLEAAEIARDAGVGYLLYYHVVPPLPLPGLDVIWLDGVDVIFPKHTLGRDGTTISLPADSREIRVVRKGL
jgi:ribonuclease Z